MIKIPDNIESELWYEDIDGNRNPEETEVFKYQVSRFPRMLVTRVCIPGQEPLELAANWNEELVTALIQKQGYSISKSILIAATACERCSNIMAHALGLGWGYSSDSEAAKRTKTECELCNG